MIMDDHITQKAYRRLSKVKVKVKVKAVVGLTALMT